MGGCILITFHEDTFYKYFKPYRHPKTRSDIWDGTGLDTVGDDLEIVRRMDSKYVWTVVEDCGGDDQWIMPGFRHINRVCYLLTRKPHDGIEVGFCSSDSAPSLTSLDLSREIAELKRLIAEATATNEGQP